jgi:hypothetical protein
VKVGRILIGVVTRVWRCKLALFGKGLMCITSCGEYFSSWEGNGGKI